MRITTIFGTSVTLAAGILIGYTVNGLNNPSPSPAFPTETALATPTLLPAPPQTEINSDLIQVQQLLNASRPLEALAILSGISPTINLKETEGKEWLRLLVDAYAATDNQNQLVLLYNQFPEALNSNEHASLAVAEVLLESQNTSKYQTLRKHWQGQENEPVRWIFLDAQSKILDGNNNEAISLLENHHFKGKDEVDRLVRLAALYLVDNPKRSWDYLSEATQHDPRNPDLRTFKASLGESLNQDHLATSDYIAAVQYDPDTPYRREQLADFYLRTGQYPQALEILQDTMDAPSLDSIWLKTLFWGHVSIPIKNSWKDLDIPPGHLRDLVGYVLALPTGIYWDQKAFNYLPGNQRYLDSRQETFWLRLLSFLKTGQEEEALNLLNDNIFHYVSWAPELEKGLKTLIQYRLFQNNNKDSTIAAIYSNDRNVENPQQMLQMLALLSETSPEQLPAAIPYQLQNFLQSNEAFVLPFLAIGWTEAALQLHALEKFPDQFPGWIAESVTKAIAQNRNNQAALEFALKQKSNPTLSLIIAETALAADEKHTAFNALKEIYTRNDESGRKAALILGQFLLDHDNVSDAKKALLAQPALVNDTTASEILARIAIQEGDLKKAYLIYLGIEKNSSEAKSFLARKAFTDKEWSRARELTVALLKEHPENPVLTDNLQKIIAEEKKSLKDKKA